MISMRKTPMLKLVAATVAAGTALTLATPSAEAQTAWSLDRYEPTPVDLFFASEYPWYNRTRPFAIRGGLIGDYARNPLMLRRPDGTSTAIVSDMLVLHAQLGVSFFDRVGINLSAPVVLLESGNMASIGSNQFAASGSPSLGDPRLGARVRLYGHADKDPFSLHVSGQLFLSFLSFGASGRNSTDGSIRGRAALVAAGRAGIVRWSASAGFHGRPTLDTGGLSTIGSELFGTAALGFVALNDKLTVGPEIWASSVLQNFASSRHVNAEALLGAHYQVLDSLLIGAGIGMGLTHGPGTPQIRGLLQIAYAPTEIETPVTVARVDTDGDGIFDDEDACVSEPAGAHPDPARNGCPLRDTDGDGVFDSTDLCINEPAGEHPDASRTGCPLHDTDSDGVFDNADQCVTTAQGEHPDPERTGCPDADQDSDGVFDHADQCRTEHHGMHPDPARAGCPLPDRDHDTVPDPTDHCPDQPGSPHPNPTRNGCPGLVRMEGGQLRILQPVYFATNRDRILPRSNRVLQAVADALAASPEVRKVSIEGHTDDAGDDTANMDLSQRRATSVMTWLTEHGVEASRLEAHGFGESRPRVPVTPTMPRREMTAARGENRRVEFRITDPAQSSTVSSPETTPAPAPTPAP